MGWVEIFQFLLVWVGSTSPKISCFYENYIVKVTNSGLGTWHTVHTVVHKLLSLVTQMHGNEGVTNINYGIDMSTTERCVADADPQNIFESPIDGGYLCRVIVQCSSTFVAIESSCMTFLLVFNCVLGSISHRFRDIASRSRKNHPTIV